MRLTPVLRTAAAAVAVLCVAAVVLGMRSNSGADDTVVTTLADAASLEKGNEVRAVGVRVGQIEDIRLENGRARVQLHVDPAVLPLHRDARIKVRPVNLLGENYIELDPGSPDQPFLESNVIPQRQTEFAVTLQDVLNTFQEPTAAALASVVTTLGEGMKDTGGKTAAALKALAPAMTRAKEVGDLLTQQNQVLDQLVGRLDPVAKALATDDGKVLDRLVGSTTTTLATVAAEHRALDRTLAELPGTVRSARKTLNELAGVAGTATPTLKELRPITGNLSEIADELQRFADTADPALASLRPVLQHADSLLEQASPVVAHLRKAGPQLRGVAASARPIASELLDEHLGDLMAFVKKWSLSTNGRDAISHYFRGVVFVTPTTLTDLANSATGVVANGPKPGAQEPSPGPLPELPLPKLSGGTSDPTDATGLTPKQEESMLGQLLGGL